MKFGAGRLKNRIRVHPPHSKLLAHIGDNEFVFPLQVELFVRHQPLGVYEDREAARVMSGVRRNSPP